MMADKYTDVRSIHVPTRVLELLDEARVAAQAGNSAQSRAFLEIAGFYSDHVGTMYDIAYYKEQEEVDNDE